MASWKMTTMMLVACSAAAPGLAVDAAKRDVVAFDASVRVEVDAAGKPVKVEAAADLPDAIRAFVEKRVASWQYTPAKLEGVPQSSTTYVAVKACAMPVAEGYRLGLDFHGNGPRTAGDRPMYPPMYPPAAQRSGTEAEFVLILAVDAGGNTKIDSIERADISKRAGAISFEPVLRDWARSVRFDLEQVAGKAVPTKVRVPVSFNMGVTDRKVLREELQAKAVASRECQMASGESGIKPIALEPAVTVTPLPAG